MHCYDLEVSCQGSWVTASADTGTRAESGGVLGFRVALLVLMEWLLTIFHSRLEWVDLPPLLERMTCARALAAGYSRPSSSRTPVTAAEQQHVATCKCYSRRDQQICPRRCRFSEEVPHGEVGEVLELTCLASSDCSATQSSPSV